jgi:flagellar secretion chaperone FliS
MPPKDAYLESQILTATPLELVSILYRATGDALRQAASHLAAGDISERSREISRAYAILGELSAALDHAQGGTLSRKLAELYDYMQRRLLEANLHQQPEPLQEVQKLLAILAEGWQNMCLAALHAPALTEAQDSVPAVTAQRMGYAGCPSFPAIPDPAWEPAAQSWSF